MATSLQDLLNEHLEKAQAIRTSQPPLPMLRGGYVEPPRPMTQEDIDVEKEDFMDKVVSGLGMAGKAALRPLTFAAEHLERTQDLFQASVLTTFGKIPLSEYPTYMKEIFHGERKISGKEFVQLAWGQEFLDKLNNMPLIPGWEKQVLTPEAHMGRYKKPVVSMGDALGVGVEFVIDPFVAPMFAPVKMFANNSRLARYASKAGLNPATSPLTFPLRKAAKALVNRNLLPGALIFHGLDPIDALGINTFTDKLQMGAKAIEDAGDFWGRTMIDLVKKHKPRKGIAGIGKRDGLNEYQLAKVFDKLFWDPKTKLDDLETALFDDMMEQVVRPLHKRMKEMGYDTHKVPMDFRRAGSPKMPRPGRDAPHLQTQQGYPQVELKRTKVWDPETEYLTPFWGTPKSYRIHPNPIGAGKSMEQKMNIHPPWKSMSAKGRSKDEEIWYNFKDLHPRNRDPFHAVEMWIESVEKQMILRERKKLPNGQWEKTGLLNMFGVKSENPNNALKTVPKSARGLVQKFGNDPQQWKYFLAKLHDVSGHRASKLEISISNGMQKFWGNFLQGISNEAQRETRRGRLVKYMLRRKWGRTDPQGLPQMPKLDQMAGMMTARTMVATLGLNLSSAIKNTSQLINTAAVHGIPATMKGILSMAPVGKRGKTLAELRKTANFNNVYRRMAFDSQWKTMTGFSFDDLMMGPFNAVENWMRGISFNIAVGEKMKMQGLHTLKDLDKLASAKGFHTAPPQLRELIETGIKQAHDTNFIYGIAGRSQFMMSPVARVGFALQSYSWKQASFIARTWQKDGGAMMRFVAMNGYLIDKADRFAGVNAENWIGWGFLPPSTLGRGPFLDSMMNLQRAFLASAETDDAAFEKAINGLRGNTREIFRLFGEEDRAPSIQAALTTASVAGMLPLPVVGVGRTVKAVNEFRTGVRESQGGKTWQHVTPDEALKSWFFTTHRQAEDKRYKEMDRRARQQVDGELDRRTRKFVKALQGGDGDEVMSAAQDLAMPIGVNVPGTGSTPGAAMRAIGFRLGEERSFWPHPDMILTRIHNRVMNKAVSRDVREMERAGWVMQVYTAEYVNRAMMELDRGAIRALRERQ